MIKPDHELATWMYAARLSLLEDGYDADAIMDLAGLDLSALTSSTDQIPKVIVQNVWREIENVTGNDAYCLRTLSHLSDPFLNALTTSIQACGSVQNALQLLFKYSQVVHPGMNFNASVSKNLELKILPKNSTAVVTPSDLDVAFGLFARICGQILASEHKPIFIRIARDEPANKEGYLSYFDCPVEFNASYSSIVFPIAMLNGIIPGEDPVLAKNLEMYLAEQVDTKSAKKDKLSIQEQVYKILEPKLHLGTPKISSVAEELGLSVRSLQRKLREEGISFSSLLTQTRLQVAKNKLSNESIKSLASVASYTGFTETSNFVRFFKQQTGQTPSSYTKQQTSAELCETSLT